ncbi:tail fiber domain-containing protein [Bacillus cereus]|nr:tail fiber domain-containing protein [Bacillus cereus]MEB9570221.1 tail fiber domain-containing protein [Bacillus cereus]
MPGPPQYLESNDPNVAALHVYNLTRRTNGPLIYGYNPLGNQVFQLFSDGLFWTAGSINTAGDIFAGRDVHARGVKLTSDKNAKENFSNINTFEILEKLASIPIQSWNYKEEPSSVRHIGPTAQDFHATFEVNGDDNMHISSVDVQGVALAAIQGLNEKLKVENDELHAKLSSLEERLSALESKG